MANTNFEKNMSDLENIVTELEKGDLNLDESISKFEEGIKISKECNKIWRRKRTQFCFRRIKFYIQKEYC